MENISIESRSKKFINKIFGTDFRCIPCIINQAIGYMDIINNTYEEKSRILGKIIRKLGNIDFSDNDSIYKKSPVYLLGYVLDIILKETGYKDYYQIQKYYWNKKASELYTNLREIIIKSENRLLTSVKLSIIGNLIDFGVGNVMKEMNKKIEEGNKDGNFFIDVIYDFLNNRNFELYDFDNFYNLAKSAGNIVYISDNAGEIIFDKLLIEELGPEKITLIARNNPILNDITFIEAAGIFDCMADLRIISDGSRKPIPAFTKAYCSAGAIEIIKNADLVISKGMGNFESMFNESDRRFYFMFVAKCNVIADFLRLNLNDLVTIRGKEN